MLNFYREYNFSYEPKVFKEITVIWSDVHNPAIDVNQEAL